ncbi:vWA domain-containing protein [Engelhardtia mirabilis]|uniref:von Willebrand factor type A domain protein n=1 Tax=Engelhardtia mirabilis TaxID=2528011 RepID=A0A518BIL5_9BACT|nr:von Willebrand factor type A domain protein [Planctomycetes bacterium Pla133]QDV01130.1 von Willebrand factor type A domain protein [Planctomycetes bacterium Pla86]
MIGLEHPELLLLAAPALWVAWTWRSASRPGTAIRFLAIALMAVAIAGPYLREGALGRDLIVVLDRSRSMPADGERLGLEVARLAEASSRTGDRLGLVTFGEGVIVDRPAREGQVGELGPAPDADGSDLAGAVETALSLIPIGRPGALVVISDGEARGGDLEGSARHAFARGIPVHVRTTARNDGADVSVERVELPDEVAVGETFQFVAWVRSDERTEARVTLERDGAELRSEARVLEPGMNRVVFRDRLASAGIAGYAVRVDSAGDRAPENDRALAGVRVRGERGVLLLNDGGATSPLSAALVGAGLPTVVLAPEEVRITPQSLAGFRAVVLENVDAGRIGYDGLDALTDFVQNRGGGLLVTGGLASFGRGGYHNSPLDPVLPVSLEMRREHRKVGVALGIALDRSGSMMAPVTGGRTKMDLANEGSATAVEMLSPLDAVVVFAVDTAAHEVVALTQVDQPGAIADKILKIESSGGGIYVKAAIEAAAATLLEAPQINRHLILFADAADSEDQDGCVELLLDLRRAGMTCSVIALGRDTDSDAKFLQAVATAGGGEAYFTEKAEDLPRLFSQDTLTAARSGFVDEPTQVRSLPGLLGIGDLPTDALPILAGYNLTYLQAEATAGAVTTDDYKAPVIAYAWYGLGRSLAYTGQVGGESGGAIVAWPGFQALFSSIVRWLVGMGEPEGVFADVERRGNEALVTVELDPEAELDTELARLEANLRLPSGENRVVALERTGPRSFEARVPIDEAGVVVGTVSLGDDRSLQLPVIGLPYSPEFERGPDPDVGRRRLARLADLSGGRVEPAAGELFEGPRSGTGRRPLRRPLLLAAILVLLIEIGFRRLDLWGLVRLPRRGARARVQPIRGTPNQRATAPGPDAEAGQTPSETSVETSTAPDSRPSPEQPSLGSALRKARGASARRLDR